MRTVLILLVILLNSSFVYANWCEDANIESCIRFEEGSGTTAEDLSTQNNDLTPDNVWSYVADTPSNGGDYSIEFALVTGGANYDSDIFFTATSGSISMWFNTDSVAATGFTYIGGSYFDNRRLYLGVKNNIVFAKCNASSDIDGSTTLLTGTWYHLAFVWSGGTGTLYLNGSSENTGTCVNPGRDEEGIGYYYESSSANTSNYFDGHIDEVAVFSDALTPTEINDIYTNGLIASEEPEPSTESRFIFISWLR
jgi:hypothetical protein